MPKPKITIKEAKLIKGVALGKTKRQAAYDAGYTGTPETVSVTASEVLKKPNVQEALELALSKYDITPDRTVQRVSEALDAEKVSIVGNGDQAMAEVTPDYTTRLSAVKIANNLMGISQKQEANTTNNFIQINNQQKNDYV